MTSTRDTSDKTKPDVDGVASQYVLGPVLSEKRIL